MNEYYEKKTIIGEAQNRDRKVKINIKNEDRSKHMYVIGKSGTGKSTLLEVMALQDIRNGGGVIFIDPHGQSVENILNYIPEERKDDVLYFDPKDIEYPIGFNIMEDIGFDKRHLVESNLISTFMRVWGAESWSDRMQTILRNSVLALLEYPNSTILDIGRMHNDVEFRKKVVSSLKDSVVKNWWEQHFAGYTDKFAAEATPAIDNKLNQFISNPIIRNIIGQPKSSFDFRSLMDEGKIILINLSKGTIGDITTRLLGSFFVTKIYLTALSRADLSQDELSKIHPVNLYVDEFQSFANIAFSEILSEARKYKLNLILANQYVSQIPGDIVRAVFGNVQTLLTFRLDAYDSNFLSNQLGAPSIVKMEDILNLSKYNAWAAIAVNEGTTKPFLLKTLPLDEVLEPMRNVKREIVELSRKKYTNKKKDVEEYITNRLKRETPEDRKEKEKPKVNVNKIREILNSMEQSSPLAGSGNWKPVVPNTKQKDTKQKDPSEKTV